MPHVVVSGEDAKCAAIRAQLVRWGLTVGSLPMGALECTSIDINSCDVLLIVDSESADGGDRPGTGFDGGWGAATKAAPCLFVSAECLAQNGAQALWARLQAAVQQARALRGSGASSAEGPELQLVGHELRSPLTAIKTALEVMEQDMFGWETAPGDVTAQRNMLHIALRNVRRLHRAVEWSQMLLACPNGEAPALLGGVPHDQAPRSTDAADDLDLPCRLSHAG